MSGLTVGTTASRLAAITVALLVGAAFWMSLVSPTLAVRDRLDAEIAVTRAGNQRLYAQVGATGYGRGRAVLTDATPALAAAWLQGEVEAIVEAAGGSISRLEAVELPAARAARRVDPVRASVAFTATIEQLREALLEIEGGPTAMIVDELSITPARADEGEEDRLGVELAVRAFRAKARGR